MDPYVYPDTTLLRNLRDIRDPDLFGEFEAEATARRLRQLEHKPLPGHFDAQHFQAIHRHIFQDVYEWAGEFRTIDLAKSGHLFALTEHIASSLNKTFGELADERYLTGADTDRFSSALRFFGVSARALPAQPGAPLITWATSTPFMLSGKAMDGPNASLSASSASATDMRWTGLAFPRMRWSRRRSPALNAMRPIWKSSSAAPSTLISTSPAFVIVAIANADCPTCTSLSTRQDRRRYRAPTRCL
jgi:Fic/DOC family